MTSPLQQKLKIHGPVVVTANRLADGAVVYRTEAGGWTTEISAAAIANTAERAKELLSQAAADFTRAVDSYVAPVEFDEGRVLPGNLREEIRFTGPTIELPGA